jgi:hypothetical protein
MPESALASSSATPSQKYSWSRAGLKSANGSTATEGDSSAAETAFSSRVSSSASTSRIEGKRASTRFSRQRRNVARIPTDLTKSRSAGPAHHHCAIRTLAHSTRPRLEAIPAAQRC